MEKFNTQEIKSISIVDILTNEGFIPEKTAGASAWYCSPLREEKTPSFKVDTRHNFWYDFGTGEHGDVIRLIEKIKGLDFIGACKYLQNANITGSQSFSFDCPSDKPNHTIEIAKIKTLENKALIQYLSTRKIPLQLAQNYLSEAYYRMNEKNYFALCFANDGGGYELRNKYFKGGTSPKYYTLMQGASTDLSIFEGFMDFLSALVYYKLQKSNNSVIVLNSLVTLPQAQKLFNNYNKVFLFLDNDNQGKKTTKELKEKFINVRDCSYLYAENKDFNEYLQEI